METELLPLREDEVFKQEHKLLYSAIDGALAKVRSGALIGGTNPKERVVDMGVMQSILVNQGNNSVLGVAL